jgi:single-strand DNA-binding protein
MSSLNSCSFIGRVGKDVDSKTLDNGKVMASFSLAVSESYKDKSGEKVENTTWVNCVSFGKLAEIIDAYVQKGDLLYVCGKMSNRTYEKDGVTKYFTEIVLADMKMLGGNKKKSEDVQEEAPGPSQGKYYDPSPVVKSKKAPAKETDDNDLPF